MAFCTHAGKKLAAALGRSGAHACTLPFPGAQLGAVALQVEEIALVTCVLRRWDGARLWWPNNLLCNNPLINLSRSNNKWEDCEVGSAGHATALPLKLVHRDSLPAQCMHYLCHCSPSSLQSPHNTESCALLCAGLASQLP